VTWLVVLDEQSQSYLKDGAQAILRPAESGEGTEGATAPVQ
jgi:hypothetical protein